MNTRARAVLEGTFPPARPHCRPRRRENTHRYGKLPLWTRKTGLRGTATAASREFPAAADAPPRARENPSRRDPQPRARENPSRRRDPQPRAGENPSHCRKRPHRSEKPGPQPEASAGRPGNPKPQPQASVKSPGVPVHHGKPPLSAEKSPPPRKTAAAKGETPAARRPPARTGNPVAATEDRTAAPEIQGHRRKPPRESGNPYRHRRPCHGPGKPTAAESNRHGPGNRPRRREDHRRGPGTSPTAAEGRTATGKTSVAPHLFSAARETRALAGRPPREPGIPCCCRGGDCAGRGEPAAAEGHRNRSGMPSPPREARSSSAGRAWGRRLSSPQVTRTRRAPSHAVHLARFVADHIADPPPVHPARGGTAASGSAASGETGIRIPRRRRDRKHHQGTA